MDNKTYIYESPDGGKTVYKRPFGELGERELVKEDKNNAARVLYTAGESIRIAAVLLSPVMPNRCADILHVFDSGKSTKWGQLKSGSKLNDHKALFPRI